jgi:hypothetical protein
MKTWLRRSFGVGQFSRPFRVTGASRIFLGNDETLRIDLILKNAKSALTLKPKKVPVQEVAVELQR